MTSRLDIMFFKFQSILFFFNIYSIRIFHAPPIVLTVQHPPFLLLRGGEAVRASRRVRSIEHRCSQSSKWMMYAG